MGAGQSAPHRQGGGVAFRSGGRAENIDSGRTVAGAPVPAGVRQRAFGFPRGTDSRRMEKLSLSWGGGRAGLTLENGETLSVKLPETFTVERLRCQASLVDELVLKGGGGSFTLDWEKDYAGKLVPAGPGGATAVLHGFDTYVIGNDPVKRDFPLVQLSNSTAESRGGDTLL